MSNIQTITHAPQETNLPPRSVMSETHKARNDISDAISTIRQGLGDIQRAESYEYLVLAHERMKKSRQFDATCTLLGIIGACLMIGSAGHNPQSQEFIELQGVGKLFEQLGSGASRFTQAEQSEIQGLIERLQALRQDAQRDDQEVERILGRLDELFARQMKQFSEAEIQMMRNSQ